MTLGVGELIVGALIAAAGALSYAIDRASQRARLRIWLAAARKCGVGQLSPAAGVGLPDAVVGCKGELDVELGTYKHGKHQGTRIEVSPLDAVGGLGLCVQSFGASIRKGLGASEVEVGDRDFDRRFLIEGPAPLALAVLDASARRRVSEALGGEVVVDWTRGDVRLEARAELANGKLTVEVPDRSGGRHDEHLAGALSTILGLAESLAAPLDVPRRLAANARQDPLWGVRLANLRALAREWPDRPETTATLRSACGDRDDDVRLHAALTLGQEGDATLEEIASSDAPDALAARAVAGLGARAPLERALHGLRTALDAEAIETACAWMDALGGRAAANSAASEPLLLEALLHADERVRVAAACALGSVGSVASVLPLQEAAQRFGGELRRLSRQAMAEIQARAAGATPGQVSLAGEGEGQVSLLDAAGGEVSIPDEPRR